MHSGDSNGKQRERENILVIDDEEGVQDSLEVLFRDDFNVFKARDGREGLRLVNSLRPDLVLLDLKLPIIPGVDVLKSMRESSDLPPVMILTAHNSAEWAARCADLGVQGYIEKPFDPFVLFERVKKTLAGKKSSENIETDHPIPSPVKNLSSVVKKAIEFIENNYMRPIPILPRDVAKYVGRSEVRFGKRFKRETGKTIGEYFTDLRIKKAKELLLEDEDIKPSHLWERLGFNSERHFFRTFKRITGKTPAAFRKSASREVDPLRPEHHAVQGFA